MRSIYRMGRHKSDIITKQIGIRLPVELWSRVLAVVEAKGTRPGGYVKALLERAVARDERSLAATPKARRTR